MQPIHSRGYRKTTSCPVVFLLFDLIKIPWRRFNSNPAEQTKLNPVKQSKPLLVFCVLSFLFLEQILTSTFNFRARHLCVADDDMAEA